MKKSLTVIQNVRWGPTPASGKAAWVPVVEGLEY